MQCPYSASQRLEKFRLFRYSYHSSAVRKRQLSRHRQICQKMWVAKRPSLFVAMQDRYKSQYHNTWEQPTVQRPYSASQRLEKFCLFRYSYHSFAVLKRQLSRHRQTDWLDWLGLFWPILLVVQANPLIRAQKHNGWICFEWVLTRIFAIKTRLSKMPSFPLTHHPVYISILGL